MLLRQLTLVFLNDFQLI